VRRPPSRPASCGVSSLARSPSSCFQGPSFGSRPCHSRRTARWTGELCRRPRVRLRIDRSPGHRAPRRGSRTTQLVGAACTSSTRLMRMALSIVLGGRPQWRSTALQTLPGRALPLTASACARSISRCERSFHRSDLVIEERRASADPGPQGAFAHARSNRAPRSQPRAPSTMIELTPRGASACLAP
jgi:hypothetical protein